MQEGTGKDIELLQEIMDVFCADCAMKLNGCDECEYLAAMNKATQSMALGDTSDPGDIRTQLQHEIKTRHIVKKRLCAKAGYDRRTLREYLSGRRSIGADALEDISEVLGCRWKLVRVKD